MILFRVAHLPSQGKSNYRLKPALSSLCVSSVLKQGFQLDGYSGHENAYTIQKA